MRILIVITACLILVSACGSHESVPGKKEAEPQKSYFPVQEYIKGEIRVIDSLPVGILRKYTDAKRRDSSFIGLPLFHQLASEFTVDELSKLSLEKNYLEDAFNDETTGYYTLTYHPKSAVAPFKRIDVLAKPGATADHVNSIYIEKEFTNNDTSITERLYWKANTSFRIMKEKKYKDQNPVVEQLLVIWDPSAY
jgi:hypothetical protein